MVDEATARRQMEEVIRNAKPLSLCEVLLAQAEFYHQGALASVERSIATGNAGLAAPAIMCQSFAIELLLKFFVVLPHRHVMRYSELKALGVDLRGHTYSTLFDRIGLSAQHRIATTFAERCGSPTSGADFRARLLELGDEPFVVWRYVYEKEGIQHLNYSLFTQVAEALGLAASRDLSPNAISLG